MQGSQGSEHCTAVMLWDSGLKACQVAEADRQACFTTQTVHAQDEAVQEGIVFAWGLGT